MLQCILCVYAVKFCGELFMQHSSSHTSSTNMKRAKFLNFDLERVNKENTKNLA